MTRAASASIENNAVSISSCHSFVGSISSWATKPEIANFRRESSADIEVERLKASLQLVATEHQIRFAKLHEKRALVIADLYTHLVEAPAHAGQFIFQHVHDAEEAAKANTKMWELYRFINLNRIYLPETICELIDKFESRLRKAVLFVDVYWTRIPNPTSDTMKEQNRVMVEACKALESEIPALLKELEREFRALLGGS